MLDLRTVYIVSAVTCSVLGIVQMIAYSSGRFERWLFWWSLSGIAIGLGLFCIGLRNILPDAISVLAGNSLVLAGYVLLVASIRLFRGRPARWGISWLTLGILSAPLTLLWSDDASAMYRISVFSFVCALGDLLVLREGLLLARREGLRSAWLVVAIYLPTALLFAVRVVLAAGGWIGEKGIYGPGSHIDVWIGLWAAPFLALRSIVINLMAAERAGNKLSHLADRDALTGVLNRGGLMRSYAGLEAGPIALMLIDVDHFKQLNDTHGHAIGDEVLRRFASSASTHLRSSDLFARHGGDEFVIVLKEARSKRPSRPPIRSGQLLPVLSARWRNSSSCRRSASAWRPRSADRVNSKPCCSAQTRRFMPASATAVTASTRSKKVARRPECGDDFSAASRNPFLFQRTRVKISPPHPRLWGRGYTGRVTGQGAGSRTSISRRASGVR